jgi:hypothetical protein
MCSILFPLQSTNYWIDLMIDLVNLKIREDLVNLACHLMKIDWAIKRLVTLIRPWLGVTFLANSDLVLATPSL